MKLDQIKFGLALADDLRRMRLHNVLPGALIPINTSIESIVSLQKRLGSRQSGKLLEGPPSISHAPHAPRDG